MVSFNTLKSSKSPYYRFLQELVEGNKKRGLEWIVRKENRL